ncbi:AAA family ATPase [Microcoleus sp. SVA1_A1]|uniref:AAA family ATPase n=1 Tax=Microcoleus sp. SVA1_A1 TaxID=2818946 RepID=UPI002FD240FF
MRITQIALKNFRAFYGEHQIDLGKKGRNLLIYGENGSGKSSLLKAIELFIDSHVRDLKFTDHRNLFVADDDGGYVKISMRSSKNAPETTYEWSALSRETDEPLIIDASKIRGSLDYKSLLEIYFLHPRDFEVDLFKLFLNTILVNVQNPLTFNLLSDEWNQIENHRIPRSEKHINKIRELQELLNLFNNGMSAMLLQLTSEVANILKYFNYPLNIDFEFLGVIVDFENKCLRGNRIILKTKFLDVNFPLAHQFLNEAKLSAIAVSIYLAALRINPTNELKVLVLDDVLIGLDMSNRLPIIDILKEEFSNYQTFLMTYDKEWYEILKRHFPSWKQVELYAGHGADYEIPILVENKKYLEKAQTYLDNHDHKAAAVYLRTAFEVKIKWFCEEMSIPIKYRERSKDLDTNDFWEAICNARNPDRTPKYNISEFLIFDIKLYRTFIMNPLSHANLAIAPTGEIQAAIDTVKELEEALEAIVKNSKA